jgi:hypothetical protein
LNAGGHKKSVIGREVDGRPLHVIDGLFAPDLVRIVYETFSRMSFTLSDYDNKETREVKHWKSEFALDSFGANPLLRAWHDTIVAEARALSGGRALTLRRVHCNSHLYGDLQHAHIDIAPGLTALYYANPDWHEEWHGETVFYDRAGEAHSVVAPRPGRLAVFPADLLHRGGVPSRKCFSARLSVAFKFQDS